MSAGLTPMAGPKDGAGGYIAGELPTLAVRADIEQGTDCMNEKAVILVVEDEALIRMGAAQMLEDAGYAVLEAGNAHEAIEILHDRNDVRAVFTDVNMPGSWDGMRLARMIRRRWPPIHLIVTSGLVSHESANLPPGARFIRKPYDIAQVTRMLRDLLGPDPTSYPINDAEALSNFSSASICTD